MDIKNKKGTTLLETLIYLALFGIIVSLVSVAMNQMLNLYSYVRIRGGASEYAQQAISLITMEIKNASGIYTPTSIFGIDSGQLSLETTNKHPAGEVSTFVDFYLDNGRLFIKREGATPELVIGDRFRTSKFMITNLNQNSTSSALRIELDIIPHSSVIEAGFGSTTIITTASLRSY
jgi:hypothetical protein